MCGAMASPPSSAASQEQTSKGIMWRDIGLASGSSTSTRRRTAAHHEAVLAIATDPTAARAKVARAMEFVRQRAARDHGRSGERTKERKSTNFLCISGPKCLPIAHARHDGGPPRATAR
jgi:hypothetical protein